MTDARDPAREDGRIDADIVARVLAGDTEQYASIVERYQRALYRHAVAMVLDHDAAADMVQDAFVRAYTNLKECRDPRRFRAWLFQTLRNRCGAERTHLDLPLGSELSSSWIIRNAGDRGSRRCRHTGP